MSSDSEPAVLFTLSIEHIETGDMVIAGLKETIFSFLVGFKGGTETKTSLGETVRLLGVWCPLLGDEGGPQAKEYLDRWALKHDHPKQHAFSKTLVAVCSTSDLRDHLGRIIALVRCTHCGACLNEDLAVNGHTSAVRVADLRSEMPDIVEKHQRALVTIKGTIGSKRFGAETLLKLMSGQTPLLLA